MHILKLNVDILQFHTDVEFYSTRGEKKQADGAGGGRGIRVMLRTADARKCARPIICACDDLIQLKNNLAMLTHHWTPELT